MEWEERRRIQLVFQECTSHLTEWAPGVVRRRLEPLVTAATGPSAIDLLGALDGVLAAERSAGRIHLILSPARAALHRLRAEVLLVTGRTGEALAAARTAVALEPDDRATLATLRNCAQRAASAGPADCVALIVTCDARQHRCAVLHEHLVTQGWIVRVVIGSGSALRHPYDYLTVAAGDGYEHLAQKTREAFMAVFESYGEGTAVLKLDDDVDLQDPDGFSRFCRSLLSDRSVAYGGALAEQLTRRDWHFHKCSSPRHNGRPFGKRGDWPYAHGPTYYLSGEALRAYYYYNARFPDEICGWLSYEDVFMGFVMKEEGLPASELDFSPFGIPNPQTADHRAACPEE